MAPSRPHTHRFWLFLRSCGPSRFFPALPLRQLPLRVLGGVGVLGGLGLGSIAPAFGHGAVIDYTIQPQVNLVARYDSGEPMTAANVTIYSPANPTEPWQTLTTDDQGRIQFSPDPSQPGEWAVKVREAGHGGLVTLNIGDSDSNLAFASSSPSSDLNPLQQGVVVASVIWGCVGTSLYFARKS